jgi:hypothetical protein
MVAPVAACHIDATGSCHPIATLRRHLFAHLPQAEVFGMQKELMLLVRATYSEVAQAKRDTGAAFDRALELVALNRPELSPREVRKEVAVAIAVEPNVFR